MNSLFITLCLSALLATVFAKPPTQSGRIVGGDVAENGQFPFTASIIVTTAEGRFFCGGALLSDRFAITSAHCIKNALEFTVQLGSVSLSTPNTNSLTVQSNTFYLHPNFNTSLFYENDVGLIELPDYVTLNRYIQPISLPTSALAKDTYKEIMGWGQTDDMTSGPVDILHFVDVIALENAACRHDYGDVVTEDIVCVVGNYNEGICIGDIGSPLVSFSTDGVPVHDGIAVFFSGDGCESLYPSGFTRTFSHIDWIKEITNIQ